MSKRFILRLCVVSTLLVFSLGGVGLWSQTSLPTNSKNQDASVNAVTPIDPQISKYAVGDVDYDLKDEVAVDFGSAGIWLYDQGNWRQLAPENPESLFAFRQSRWYSFSESRWRYYIYVVADLGSQGLWMWERGTWKQYSAANVESMADGLGYTGGSTPGEVFIGDFGRLGLWQYAAGWRIESGADADGIIAMYTMHIADFGSLGLWQTGGGYYYAPPVPLSGANPDHMIKGRRLLSGAERLICDFGALGLWEYYMSLIGGVWTDVWTNLSGADADFIASAEIDADGVDEIVGDFGAMGLWLWDTQWTQLTDANAEYMISADVTGDGTDEIAVDFGSASLWVWNDGPWSQISVIESEYILSADTNGDGAKEILTDFGASGLWMWNGAWTRISEDNPD